MYYLSYSKIQDAFHVETEDQMINSNIKIVFSENIVVDFLPIFKGNHDECLKKARELRSVLGKEKK